MRLVPDWRSAWRFLSVQIAIIGAALQGAILAFPSLKDWLGDTATHCVGLMMLGGIVAGRLVDQDKRKCNDAAP